MKDEHVALLFADCYTNTLDTTVQSWGEDGKQEYHSSLLTTRTMRERERERESFSSHLIVFHVSVFIFAKIDTFIVTGDIEAMWLRDSAWQVYPYLQYIQQDITVKHLIQV